jgi:hypothetical protein
MSVFTSDCCGNCQRRLATIYPDILLCRRNPPVVMAIDDARGQRAKVTAWPEVRKSDWCAEHQL